MSTRLTSKGQVTIPKRIRDALKPGAGLLRGFSVNREGEVVIRKLEDQTGHKPDRFEAARGKADIPWRTDALMALLRGEE